MATLIGETLSHFEILEFIGKGGFGEVYRARDTDLDRTVALKVLPEAVSADPAGRARFRREARAASRLTHPNVCTIYEFGEQGTRTFIAMEFVAGRTLKERIWESPLAPMEALDVAIQIAEGLASAHAIGILHLDIKSANIVLTASGNAKILDFGLARLAASGQHPPLDSETWAMETTVGTVAGTLPYMAPEQLRGRQMDPRTDQFAFGVVLFELLSGRLPFSGTTVYETSNATLSQDPPALASLVPGLPPQLGWIVQRMLAKDPADRFASSDEVSAALKEVRRQLISDQFTASPALGRETVTGPRIDTSKMWRRVPSIAVLAFENLSGDGGNEYFSDGLSEDLTNTLAHIPGLRVASRTSAFFFKGKNKDIREIASALGVETVLEGSVRKSGNRIRVTAQLINATDGYHIWSESYDRHLEDVFELQDEVSRTIVETLEVKLLGPRDQPMLPRHTQNVEAYNLYLQGRYHWNRRYKGGMQTAMRFFQQAKEMDPSFALPYSGLADALGVLAFYGYLPPNEGFPKSKAAAEAALRIDNTIAEAHASLAFAKTFYDWDWTGGERSFSKALQLEPNYATARWWNASAILVMGRPEDSDRELQLALKAEPLSAIITGGAAFHSYLRRQFEKGLEQARRSLELDPAFGPSHAFQGWCLLELGHFEDAAAEWLKTAELMQNLALARAMLGVTYARSGQNVAARRILVELVEQSHSTWTSPYPLALLCAALGEKDDAFEWLERAYEGRNNWLPFLRIDPCIDPLRGDPRLDDLIKRVGLPAG